MSTDRLHAARDDGDALRILGDAVRVPSVTGHEADLARWAKDLLDPVMDRTVLDSFADDRANLFAEWRGPAAGDQGGGLALVAHADTVAPHDWEEHWAADVRHDPFGAAEVDGAIWGRGVADCKSGLAAAIAAVRQFRRAGLAPGRQLSLLFLADEESGEAGSGYSDGARRAVAAARAGTLSFQPDLLVYGEPTDLRPSPAHMGFTLVEVEVHGKASYFSARDEGIDALEATESLLARLRGYANRLRQRPPHPLIGRPGLTVTSVHAGDAIAIPGEARVSLIRWLTPDESLDGVRAELEGEIGAALAGFPGSSDIRYPTHRDHPLGGSPYEVALDQPAVARGVAVMDRHSGKAAEGPDALGGWSEGPFFAGQLGIPTVYFGAGALHDCHTWKEHVRTDDHLRVVAAYVDLIAEFCGIEPLPPTEPAPRHHSATT